MQPGGTAPRARIVGWRVGGKTGTAHKEEAAHKYVSSFVGFAPVSDPRLVIAVMLDEPSDGQYYGGQVAAPVFSQVMQGALRLLGAPYDAPLSPIEMPGEAEDAKESTLIDDVLALLKGAAIKRLTSDSRRAAPGAAFFAWPGETADGRRYIAAGDRARLRGGGRGRERTLPWDGGWRVPNAGVKDLKSRAGFVAHEFYGRPLRIAVGLRRHRHQRQDVLLAVARACFVSERNQNRRDRHAGQRFSTGFECDREHDARRARAASPAR